MFEKFTDMLTISMNPHYTSMQTPATAILHQHLDYQAVAIVNRCPRLFAWRTNWVKAVITRTLLSIKPDGNCIWNYSISENRISGSVKTISP